MTIDRQLRLDPYPMYAQMRRTAPVLYNPEQGAWLVYSYDEVKRVIGEHQSFSSDVFRGVESELLIEDNIQMMDPPRHTQLRALATYAFTPKAVAELEPRIRQIADELLDEIAARNGEADFVGDFTIPLPVIVIAEMLGIPKADRPKFKLWSDAIVESAERLMHGIMEALPEHVTAFRAMRQYFREITLERRANPQSDLISRLAVAEVEGKRLSDQEVVSFCLLLMVAGNETTTNLLSNAMRTFLEHPDQWERLCREPRLIPQAIEEVLRYRSPVQSLFRIARHDLELGGQQIKAGQQVVFFIGSANRDERKFENADVFDITRAPGAHLGFGHGIHFCLGAPLARLEAKIALEALAERVESFRMPPGSELEPLSTFIVFGLKQLPLQLKMR
ncbi:MAG TPA: cytochrome P450 [Symbiobacteriaceae bacterium]|nr:cytochrome P450 [Symbiobacteriaceae bacterium]